MLLLELHRIGKPADSVAERADRELDQDLAVARVVLVRQHQRGCPGLVELPDVDAEADEEALGGGDEGTLVLALEQDIAGVEIAQLNAPAAVGAIGKQHPGALIDIETDSFWAPLCRLCGGGRIS